MIKLTPPASDGVYPRRRLLEELDRLRRHGVRTWGEAGRAGHLRAAAAILEGSDQLEHAQALYLEANDIDAATRVILMRAPVLAAAGRMGVLESMIAQLPETMLARVPWLQYWKGVCHLVTDLMAARACSESAFRLFRASGDAPGSYLAWAGIVDSFVFLWGEFSALPTLQRDPLFVVN